MIYDNLFYLCELPITIRNVMDAKELLVLVGGGPFIFFRASCGGNAWITKTIQITIVLVTVYSVSS